jgi:nucleoside-diphosphate kinase
VDAEPSRVAAGGILFAAVHSHLYQNNNEFGHEGHGAAAVREKDHAVEDFRNLIGETDPSKAEAGTIRNKYAKSIDANAIHGSDSDENAQIEGSFFFTAFERF